jgi:chromosome segregation ATPase
MIMSDTRRPFFFSAVLVVCAIAAFAMRGSAQAQQPSGTDVLPALLQEVHGLRAAMEQMATSNAHAQLLVGRLQLQESRMNGMIRRLDTVRDDLAKAEREYAQISGALKMLEGDSSPSDVPDKDRNTAVAGLKQQAQYAKAEVDRLRAEEAQLTSDLTAEQARWVDINQRLDELERSLKK